MALDIMSLDSWFTLRKTWKWSSSSSHHGIHPMDNAMATYHLIPGENIESRIAALERIIGACSKYVTDKKAANKWWLTKNQKKKIAAADTLYGQAHEKLEYLKAVLQIETLMPYRYGVKQRPTGALAKFRSMVKTVQGGMQYAGKPSQGKVMDLSYWHEVIDPKHRNWHMPKNNPVFAAWQKMRFDDKTTTLSFYRWLEKITDGELNALGGGDLLETAYQTEEGREAYRVFLDLPRGTLQHLTPEGNMVPFSTEGYKTNFGGKGWCIFVLSPEGKLYANNHDGSKGWFHAAFLGGKPVICAGELFVREGILYGMTPKSGHYKPRDQDMFDGLTNLRDQGAYISRLQMLKFKRNRAGQPASVDGKQTVEWYDAQEWVLSAGQRGLLRDEVVMGNYRLYWDGTTFQMIPQDWYRHKNTLRGRFIPDEKIHWVNV